LWYWTWSGNVNVGSTNLGIAFSGLTDPGQAISNAAATKAKLPGQKYISLGGGNAAGRWSSGVLSSITSYCNGKKFSGYNGIAFDIEEGDAGLGNAFIMPSAPAGTMAIRSLLPSVTRPLMVFLMVPP